MNRFLCYILGLFFVSTSAYAQSDDSTIFIPHNDRTYTQIFDSLTAGLIPARVPYGVLYDRVYPWSEAAAWQSGDTTSMYRLFQTWHDMEYSRVDTTAPVTYDAMRQIVNNMMLSGHLPVLFISYDFARIDLSAVQDGRLSFADSILTDNNFGLPPYTTHHVNMAGLPITDVCAEDTLILEYNNDLHRLSNINNAVLSIRVTDVTEGWQCSLEPNNTQSIVFTQLGIHEIIVEITLGDSSLLTSHQLIRVKNARVTNNGNFCDPVHRVVASTIPYQGFGEQYATTSNADWHIYYHLDQNGHCEYTLKKPIIIIDGYDPDDATTYDMIYDRYLAYFPGGSKALLGDSLRVKGYDVIILNSPKLGEQHSTRILVPDTVRQENSPGNFTTSNHSGRNGGTDFIERNAFVLVKLIQQINDSLTANSSNNKLVVVGPSMGGQISRFALAYMEKQDSLGVPKMSHNCRLWISFDSPHWGANIPIALQSSLYYYGTTGRNVGAKDAYNSKLFSPAGRQLLIEQYGGLYDTEYVRGLYKASLANNGLFNSGGYPMGLRKVALLNGNGAGIQDFSAGALYADLRGKQWGREIFRWKNWFMPGYNATSNCTDLTITITPPVINSSSFATFLSYLFGNFNVVVHNSNNVTNINPHGSMDVVPGSNYNSIYTSWNIFDSVLQLTTNTTSITHTLINTHTFIPTISALGFYNPNFAWDTRVDDRDLVCNNEIPFDNYYMPKTNEQHITLTPENVDWLKQEIYNGDTFSNCPHICAYADNWPSQLCHGSTYQLSVNDVPSGYTVRWETETTATWPTSNLVPSSQTGNPMNVTANRQFINNPNNKLIAYIVNPCGADYKIEKTFGITKASAPPPIITIDSTPTSGRWIANHAFAAPPSGVTTSWTVYNYRTNISDNGSNSGIGDVLALNGDTVAWSLFATGMNSCGNATYSGSYRINSDGSKTDLNIPLARIVSSGNTLSVIPNPASSFWAISYTITGTSHIPVNVVITDLNGKRLLTTKIIDPHHTIISCEHFASGLYIGSVQFDDGATEIVKLRKE